MNSAPRHSRRQARNSGFAPPKKKEAGANRASLLIIRNFERIGVAAQAAWRGFKPPPQTAGLSCCSARFDGKPFKVLEYRAAAMPVDVSQTSVSWHQMKEFNHIS
jgi:hypothetical protein